jgi:hypothetical protein
MNANGSLDAIVAGLALTFAGNIHARRMVNSIRGKPSGEQAFARFSHPETALLSHNSENRRLEVVHDSIRPGGPDCHVSLVIEDTLDRSLVHLDELTSVSDLNSGNPVTRFTVSSIDTLQRICLGINSLGGWSLCLLALELFGTLHNSTLLIGLNVVFARAVSPHTHNTAEDLGLMV